MSDPLPASIDASPYRARPSGPALPLYQGESCAVDFASLHSPPWKGGEPRSGRGSLTRHVGTDFLFRRRQMTRADIIAAILKSLRSTCAVKGIAERSPFNESTQIIGSDAAVLDSLGVVMFLVRLEELMNASSVSETLLVQKLMAHDLGDETVGSLAERVISVLGGAR